MYYVSYIRLLYIYAESGACVRIAGPEAEVARQQPNRERLCSPQDPRRGGLEGAHRDVCGRATCTQEEEAFENGGRRAARVAAAVAGSNGNGGAQPLPSVTGRRVMISRELLVYLAEPDQIDVDGFNLLGF